MKLLGIISVGFEAKDQLLIAFFSFVRYWKKVGVAVREVGGLC
jgi:hypothetical protein